MIEMLGSKPNFTTADIQEHLRSIITSNITDIIADSKYSAIDLSSKLTQFNEIARTALQNKFFGPIGLTLSTFVVENISFPENVEKAIDERSGVGIMADKMGSYVAMQQAQAMRDAAKNQGSIGTMFGMGMMGGMGGMVQGNPGGGFGAMNQAQDRPAGGFCSGCGAALQPGAKFCGGCGAKQGGGNSCKCGAAVKPGAKFCPECGTKV